jgi:2-succinyl-6-hydroxy-2,4-cyclohexadiene-1-carboxylate synthase
MPQILLEPYNLSYELRGKSSSTKLLFLHGFMGCGADFASIIDTLLPGFCCLTVDLPGHGQTQVLNPLGYNVAAIAPALVTLLHRLSFAPCHLIGYSMGGRLALYLACRFPQMFTSVLLESASPGLATEPKRCLRRQQDETLATELESGDWPAFLTRWYNQPLFSTLKRSPQFDEIFQRRLRNHPHQLAQVLRGFGTGAQPSLWNRLPSLQMALTLVVGEQDLKFVQINQSIAAQLPFAHLNIMPGCGHVAHSECPTAFVAALKAHLVISIS